MVLPETIHGRKTNLPENSVQGSFICPPGISRASGFTLSFVGSVPTYTRDRSFFYDPSNRLKWILRQDRSYS